MPTEPSPFATEEHLLRPIHPAIKSVWRIGSLTSFLVTAAIFMPMAFGVSSGLLHRAKWPYFVAIALAIFIAGRAFVFAGREWQNWRYGLTDSELLLQWGVFWRTYRVVPRAAIQHLDINQGPIDRKFGLFQVSIFVAGAHGAVASIPGLPKEEAEELRKYLGSREEVED